MNGNAASATLALLVASLAPAAGGQSALAVHRDGGWHEWWRSDRAPARWEAADPAVAGAIEWRTAAPGLEWGELRLSGEGEAWRIGVIVARIDPARLRLALHSAPADDRGRAGLWTIDEAPAEALLAVNAGQFDSRGPWGWVVRAGAERRPPGTGPLAPAVVVDPAGRVRFVPADSIEAVRGTAIVEGFQSYPTLLGGDGEVPAALARAGLGVDVGHRDARLALGELRDGRVLLALTRFEGLGGILSNLPFGLTTPEMAALMGALGSRRAVLLDGGISSQLLIRDDAGTTHAWHGIRKVPLGLVVLPRR